MYFRRLAGFVFRQVFVAAIAPFAVLGSIYPVAISAAEIDLIPTVSMATCSSERAGRGCSKALDGVVDGYPTDPSKEWSAFGTVGSWIHLDWAAPVSINKVVLHDRILSTSQITAGFLNFSDGSQVPVSALLNDGAETIVSFPARTVSWVQFDITQVSSGTVNTGLAEIRVFGSDGMGNRAPLIDSGPTMSPSPVASGATAALSVSASDADNDALSYEWSVSTGSISGSGATVTFVAPTVTLDTLSTVSVTVRDTSGTSVSASANVTIAAPSTSTTEVDYRNQVSSAVCSTQRSGRWCIQAIDGVVDGYPSDPSKEWSSSEKAGAWIQLNFASAVMVNQVMLHDRILQGSQNTQGLLSFSDGTSLPVGALPNDGAGLAVDFSARAVTWLRYTVTSVSSSTISSGLAEIAPKFVPTGSAGGDLFNEALFAFPVVSAGASTAEQAQDGKTGVPGNGWVAAAQGDALELHFDSVKSISKIELADSVGTDGQVTLATVSFSDGSILNVANLPTNGAVTPVTFAAKNVTWMKVTLTGVLGVNFGLSEVAAYSVLNGQQVQANERFANGAGEWSFVDNTASPSIAKWSVTASEVMQQTVRNFAQTSDGFQLGTYAIWNTASFNGQSGHGDMDLRVRVRAMRSGKLETGVVGVMFGYQDDNNYYRLSLATHKGYRKLEKRVNGVFTQLAGSSAAFEPNEWNNVRILFMNGLINVYVDGQFALTAVDTAFASGKIGLWNSWTDNRTEYDNLFVLSSPSARSVVGLSAPVELAVQSGLAVTLMPRRAGALTISGYELVVDEGTALEQKRNVGLTPSNQDLTFTFSTIGTHTFAVYGRNNQGQRVGTPESSAKIAGIGVGGLKLVTLGDSITTGMFDTIIEDDVSVDGRNASGGYQPVLNDKLSQHYNLPVSVIDDSNPGDKASDGISKINSILARNGTASALLVMYGANDSSGSLSTDPLVFKSQIKQIVDAVIADGKIGKIFIGRTAPRLGKVGQSNNIKAYNQRIAQLVTEYAATQPGKVFLGPDFYAYFSTHQTEYDADGIHFNGVGYQSMGQLWYQVLQGKL